MKDKKVLPKKNPTASEISTKVMNLYYGFYGYEYNELDEKLVKEMLKDPDIFSAWNSRKNCIQAREWKITSTDKNEALENEIELRFSGLNMSTIIGEILDSKIFRRTFHEITWKEPFDWKYDKLIKEPNYIFKLDQTTGKWTFNNGNALPEDKFIISVNQATHEQPFGESLFLPLMKTFERKNLSYTSIYNFIKRFYDIIMWYIYDDSQEEEEILEQMRAMKKVKGQDVLGLPSLNGDNAGLNKSFGFMTLENFSTETQQTILRLCVQEIEMVIKGASFAKAGDTAGSYSKDSVSNEVRNDIIESDVKYLRDILQQLIIIDAEYFGYDSNTIYFSFIKGEDKLKKAEIKEKEETADKIEAEKLSVIKSLGFDISAEYISERFRIPMNAISKSKLEFEEFEENPYLLKKKEKNRKLSERFYSEVEEEKENFIEALKKQFSKSIINSVDDIQINLEFPERFKEILILSNLYGMANISDGNIIDEFEESNPFKMKFNEAIKYFMNKIPNVYERFEAISDKYISNNFWIKKITDLELTKKVKKSLEVALNEGKTLEYWKKNIDLKGMSDWYLETVFRTNIGSAYSAGRYEQQMNGISDFPYWLFDAVMDNRTSELCSELDGKIYRADNPIWQKIYPPLHYNCRSDVIALSKYDLKQMNITIKSVDVYDLSKSQNYTNFLEKSVFSNNPFEINYEKLYNNKRFL